VCLSSMKVHHLSKEERALERAKRNYDCHPTPETKKQLLQAEEALPACQQTHLLVELVADGLVTARENNDDLMSYATGVDAVESPKQVASPRGGQGIAEKPTVDSGSAATVATTVDSGGAPPDFCPWTPPQQAPEGNQATESSSAVESTPVKSALIVQLEQPIEGLVTARDRNDDLMNYASATDESEKVSADVDSTEKVVGRQRAPSALIDPESSSDSDGEGDHDHEEDEFEVAKVASSEDSSDSSDDEPSGRDRAPSAVLPPEFGSSDSDSDDNNNPPTAVISPRVYYTA